MQVIARIMSLLNATPQAEAQVSGDGGGFSLDGPTAAPSPRAGLAVAIQSDPPGMARAALGLTQGNARSMVVGAAGKTVPIAVDMILPETSIIMPETSGSIMLGTASLSVLDTVGLGMEVPGQPPMSEMTEPSLDVALEGIVPISSPDTAEIEAETQPAEAAATKTSRPSVEGRADQPATRAGQFLTDLEIWPIEADPAWPVGDAGAVLRGREEDNTPVAAEKPPSPATVLPQPAPATVPPVLPGAARVVEPRPSASASALPRVSAVESGVAPAVAPQREPLAALDREPTPPQRPAASPVPTGADKSPALPAEAPSDSVAQAEGVSNPDGHAVSVDVAPSQGSAASRTGYPRQAAATDMDAMPAPLPDPVRTSLAATPAGAAPAVPIDPEAAVRTAEVPRYTAPMPDGGRPSGADPAGTPTLASETDAPAAIVPRRADGTPVSPPHVGVPPSAPVSGPSQSTNHEQGETRPAEIRPAGQVGTLDGAPRQAAPPSPAGASAPLAGVVASPGGGAVPEPERRTAVAGDPPAVREAMVSAPTPEASLSQSRQSSGTVMAPAAGVANAADLAGRRRETVDAPASVGIGAPVEGSAPRTDGPSPVTPPLGPQSADPATVAANARLIAEAIALGAGRERVEVRLDPPELGRVSIDMAVDGGTVSATVSADRPETLDLLRRHVDTLQRELSASGFGRADIGFADRGGGGQAQGAGSAAASAETAAAPAPQPIARSMPRTLDASGRLDIRL